MKELNEKELKRLLEEQLEHDGKQRSTGNDDDVDLYRLLFTALADEPTALPGLDLADAVIGQIKAREQKRESIRYKIAIVAVILTGLVFAYFSANYINPSLSKPILNFIATYKWLLLFIILCFGVIEIADKNLVKKNLLSS
jgi:hypothetical protein